MASSSAHGPGVGLRGRGKASAWQPMHDGLFASRAEGELTGIALLQLSFVHASFIAFFKIHIPVMPDFRPPMTAMTGKNVVQRLFSSRRNMPLIGCAGWSIPSSQRLHFPVSGSQLERYAAVLPAVEINSSFYRPHRPDTYRRWRDSVPDAFRFSVKLPRTLTHVLRLQNTDALLSRFLQEAGELGDKLGCLLVQLPPSLHFAAHAATAFFLSLKQRVDVPIVCEARHRSWFEIAAADALAALGISQVIADPPVAMPPPLASMPQTVYVRLHGSPHMYHSAYPEAFLLQMESKLRQCLAQGKTAWCIFDNTASGAAMPDALSLLARFDGKLAPGLLTHA